MNEIITIAILISSAVLIMFWAVFFYCFKTFTLNNSKIKSDINPGVSVIVAYKNAESTILNTIKNLLKQDYPDFEIIAVNDFSIDAGPANLSKINNEKLILLNVKEDKPGKKAALEEAIRLARFDILLFTDADCMPASRQWIKTLTDALISEDKFGIVLGYGPMIRHQGLLNLFIRYETFITAFQYFSYAALKIPYMGVGRNIMYKKSIFYDINGFSDHENISSGDDDLFVSSASNFSNTTINLNPESFVWSEGKSTLVAYLHQKTRHISTSLYYSTKHQILLGLFSFMQVLFYISWIIGVLAGIITITSAVFLLLTKWLTQMILQNAAMQKLQVHDLNKFFPLTDVIMFVYYLVLPVYSLMRNKEW